MVGVPYDARHGGEMRRAFFGKFLLFKSCLVSAQALKVVNFPEAFAAGGEDLSRCPWLRSVFTLQS
jgi:hypothetical protein